MNFKHCTQDEIYPTRYLVLQVIDIAKPHCHLSSEAESLWVFFALSYVVHIIKEISFQVLFVVVSIRSIPFFAGGFASNLYLYSKWNMAAETNFCLKSRSKPLRSYVVVHIWGTRRRTIFLKTSISTFAQLWLMRLKSDGWLTICELTGPEWIFPWCRIYCFIFQLGVFLKVGRTWCRGWFKVLFQKGLRGAQFDWQITPLLLLDPRVVSRLLYIG